MSGQKVGYIRVSSTDQNPERQLDGEALDKTFTEYASAKDVERPELQAMLAYVREGDTLIVHSMDRLARNVDDSAQPGQRPERARGTRRVPPGRVDLRRQRLLDGYVPADRDRCGRREFERSLIRERQRQGIEAAKKRGAYQGGTRALKPKQHDELMTRIAAGERKSRLAREFGISERTLYRYVTQAAGSKSPTH